MRTIKTLLGVDNCDPPPLTPPSPNGKARWRRRQHRKKIYARWNFQSEPRKVARITKMKKKTTRQADAALPPNKTISSPEHVWEEVDPKTDLGRSREVRREKGIS
ncbi:hypothetical protein AALP_AA4G202600 [Arabis alpina]|uniref:Uncharacterized protein n=1 Tax=Arabis alpina TaxID=50452 RepID=A0A087H4H4_ARAAL|nr:hypothetical protein AALP_AA4G202600 [Arabis alpina]